MSTPYNQYPSLYTQWAAALHNAFPAISFKAFFTWITAEGSPGYQNNNPLNIPYYSFLQPYGAWSLGPGLANTAAFPTQQAGLQATIDAITGKLPFSGAINGIGNFAQSNPGNDVGLLQYVQLTGWASSGYNGGLPGLYNSIDFTGSPPSQSSGGGFGGALGGFVNNVQNGINNLGNAISGNGTISIPNPFDAVGSATNSTVNQVESWLRTAFGLISKWVILALIAIAMFFLFYKLVGG